jgi:hypothetical protein
VKVSKLVASPARSEPVPPPSPVHAAFVVMLGQVAGWAARGGNPVAQLMARLVPRLLPDIAEVPAMTLREAARHMAGLLSEVADAPLEGEVSPEFLARLERLTGAISEVGSPTEKEGEKEEREEDDVAQPGATAIAGAHLTALGEGTGS